MNNISLRKRFWITFGLLLLIPCLLVGGIKLIQPSVSYQFNAQLEDLSWTGQEAWLLYTDNDQVKLLTPQGKIMKYADRTSTYLDLRPVDTHLAAMVTTQDNQADTVELILNGQLTPLPLPPEVKYVNHLSLSPDANYMLLYGMERHEEPNDFYFTHQAWVYDQTLRTWIPVATDETSVLGRGDYLAVEWVVSQPHTVFVQLQKQAPNGPQDFAHYMYDAQNQSLDAVDVDAAYEPTQVVPNIYGEIDPSSSPVQYQFHQIGKNKIVVNDQELLSWWNLGIYTEYPLLGWFDLVDIGHHKIVIRFKREVGVLDTQTGQFAKLMDVPYDKSIAIYSLQVVPSGFTTQVHLLNPHP